MSTALPKPTLITDDAEDAKLASARALARLMDSAFVIPGTNIKIGLDPLLGLLPGVGDAISSAIGGYIVLIASHMGVSKAVQMRMVLNLVIDAVVGAVPFVGDLLDIGWKANIKNVNLLERALADPDATRRSSRWMVAAMAFAVFLIGAAGAGLAWLVIWAVKHA